MKKELLFLLIFMVLVSGCGNSTPSESIDTQTVVTSSLDSVEETVVFEEVQSEERVVTDCYGYEINVPVELKSISTNYQSATQIMLMLGGEKIITGTSPKTIARPWVQLIYPEFCQTVSCPYDQNNEFNVEELLKQKPELFLSYNTSDTELVRNAGITTANIGLYDYPGIETSILKIGEIMGEVYFQKAQEWDTYYQERLSLVQERVSDIPEDEKVRVLFLRGDFERTYGQDSVISSWINLAGGINVLDGLESKESIVMPSAEEILGSNPDLIIIGDTSSYTKAYETITTDERFTGMDVIVNNKILFNPNGVHQWEKYSGEIALQLLWAGKTFYPERFEDIDLIEETKYFYKTFHNFTLTDEQAQLMIDGKTPDGGRT